MAWCRRAVRGGVPPVAAGARGAEQGAAGTGQTLDNLVAQVTAKAA
jgi:hypothetical protein